MIFSSILFLCIFLPIMIIGYYVLPKKLKNGYLLLGSLFFYAWGEPKYIFIMLASIIGNYCFGMLIHYLAVKSATSENAPVPWAKKTALITAILFNLAILIYFKYFMLIVTTIDDLFHAELTIPEIVLPIGISFYIFKGISYLIDVYRVEGKKDEDGKLYTLAEKNPINLALYISLFPQLMAGPIGRYPDMKNALTERVTNVTTFSKGVERFIIGLAKKAIIANSIGEIADKIFASDTAYMGTPVAWLGAVFYTLYIYYDFSGYSDMAIGLGKIFGFDFLENFNYPYISKSITEFWRRWHISLSSWFRDYLYIPLGGSRTGNVYFNLLVVFLATGIWHGASWGFLVWGLWHGAFMLIERAFRGRELKFHVPAFVKWLYTMLIVTLGWVLFKLEELETAFSYIGTMFHVKNYPYTAFSLRYYLDNKMIVLFIFAVLAAVPWAQVLPRRLGSAIASVSLAEPSKPVCIIKRAVLLALLLLSMIFIVNSTYNPFVYFKF